MSNDKKQPTIIEKETKAKEDQRKAELDAIPPSLSNLAGYGGNRNRLPTPAAQAVELPDGTVFRPIGVTTRFAKPKPPTPDWDFWLNMPEVKLWQAAALSMNIDPDSLRHHPQAWMAGPGGGPIFTNDSFSSGEQQIMFYKRLRLLVANKSVKNGFSPGTLSMDNPAYHSVRLSEFSNWAQSIGRDIPDELAAIAIMPVADANAHEMAAQPMKPTAPNAAKPPPAKDGDGGIVAVRVKETPGQRKQRLQETCDRKKAAGVHAWKRETAFEENISVTMLDRILRRGNSVVAPKTGTVEALKAFKSR